MQLLWLVSVVSLVNAIVHVPIKRNAPQVMEKRAAIYDPLIMTKGDYWDPKFYLTMGVGTPSKSFNMFFDTSTTDSWVDGNYTVADSSTGTNTTSTYSRYYGGSFAYVSYTITGWWMKDTVSLPTGESFKFKFGATGAKTMKDFNGILGLAPVAYASDTDNVSPINALKRASYISTRSYSIYMSGASAGSVTFGGIDTTKYTGSLFIVPIVSKVGTSPAFGVRRFYGYDEDQQQAVLVYEGLTPCVISSGEAHGVLPKGMAVSLANAFNVTKAANVPEALALGYNATHNVFKYTGNVGFAMDVGGVVFKVPATTWMVGPDGNYLLDVEPVAGRYYRWALNTNAAGSCLLGEAYFIRNFVVAADYDKMQFAIAKADLDADVSASNLVEIGTGGFAALGATSAPVYSDTASSAIYSYPTATWSYSQPW